MRYLNKITFINSAAIRYAEVTLDGNVHFIGTQGVGKSTVLRAILFFYNGDTQRLGISKEKKPFSEYYFPYANSYIIYEVATGTGGFCIMAFKSQGKVCFRFVDSPYQREHYIDAEGHAHENWDRTRNILNANNIDYSAKIDLYEEYRKVLYGDNEGLKNYKKYALIESKQYQNIPRTIQNVFLNSKLEAEFIKQTIIMSMSDDDVTISLQTYAHHLKDFEGQLNDIQKFRQANVQNQAQQVSDLFIKIRHLEREKKTLGHQLGYSIHQIRKKEPVLLDKLVKEELKREKHQAKLDQGENAYTSRIVKVQGQLTLIEDKLKSIKKKSDHYQRINIQQIIQRVGKKAELETEAANLNAEKQVLTDKYKQITHKYAALLKELTTQLKEDEGNNKQQRLDIETEYLTAKESITEYSGKLIAEIRGQFTEKLKDQRAQVESIQERRQQVEVEKAGIRHKRFFEEELDALKAELNTLQASIQKAEHEIKAEHGRIETLQKQWELENTAAQNSFNNANEKLEEKIAALEKAITEIDQRISNSKDSFYGWLNEQVPGWENTIGKVIDENVLFSNALTPAKSSAGKDSFYGVKIDLKEISKSVKTIADYEKEKQTALADIDLLKIEIQNKNEALQEELEKCRRKYQPLIKEAKNTINENKYLLEQYNNKLTQAKVNIDRYSTEATVARQGALMEVDGRLEAVQKELNEAKAALAKTEEEQSKQLKAREKERDKKLEELLNDRKQKLKALEDELSTKRNVYKQRTDELNKQQQDELTSKGANTKRLTEIDSRTAVIRSELHYIEQNRDIVAEYNKDKRELFDLADEYKNQKELQEQKLKQEEQKHEQQKQNLQRELTEIMENVAGLQREMEHIQEDLMAMEEFMLTEAYASVSIFAEKADNEYENSKRPRDLIKSVNEHYYRNIQLTDEIKTSINSFLGNFTQQNIFNFKTNIQDKDGYLTFAAQLNDFIDEDKISEFEKRVNERFAAIIKNIGQETTNLISREGEIQSIIHKINKDFTEKNFAGVIRKIELKMDESANKVVYILKLIKNFNDENAYDFGTINLFTTPAKQEAQNKKAVDLLKAMLKEINNYKRDYISLSDSFELKFRIEENQNDTGWVEKLSNVGSEGTDILVKAMINIMLLNVFKEGASHKFKDFRLHCVMDEIGRLHPSNVRGILKFANDRDILLINGSPTEHDALAYKHIYKLDKDDHSITRVKRIITQYAREEAVGA
jgi:chromosome segregation ATPase